MKRNKVYLQWRTAEEKDFIRYLYKKHPKKFENYVNSTNLRKKWGDIHSHKIVDFLIELQK